MFQTAGPRKLNYFKCCVTWLPQQLPKHVLSNCTCGSAKGGPCHCSRKTERERKDKHNVSVNYISVSCHGATNSDFTSLYWKILFLFSLFSWHEPTQSSPSFPLWQSCVELRGCGLLYPRIVACYGLHLLLRKSVGPPEATDILFQPCGDVSDTIQHLMWQ